MLGLKIPCAEGLIYGDDCMAHTVPDETQQLSHALWQGVCNNWVFFLLTHKILLLQTLCNQVLW